MLLFKSFLLKKWHFLDLVCSVHVVTNTTECSHSKQSLLKMWHFLDLLCAIYVATMRIEVYFVKNPLPQKVVLSGPNMFSLVVTITLGFSYRNRSLLKKWHFLDIVCSVYLVTITTGCSYSNRSLLKKWHFLDLICAIYVVTMRIEVYYVKSPLL